MQPFTYHRASTLDEASHLARQPGSVVMAGATTVVDLMRLEVMRPGRIVDIGHLDELRAFDTSGAVLRFGALARMADVAGDAVLNRDYPALAESLQLAASPQIRHAATVGGNLLQRTRCPYFRDGASACNKRQPGSGCAAIDGVNRDLAVLGTSERCVASYPGDWGTALAAFDTSIEIRSTGGRRTVPLADFHLGGGAAPEVETVLQPGEIVTAILVQPTPLGRRSTYLKARDRQSYAYALASAAVALVMDGEVVQEARVALGGVAAKPWRAFAAERVLAGRTLDDATRRHAGEAAFADARPLSQNAFKIELGTRLVGEALLIAARRGI